MGAFFLPEFEGQLPDDLPKDALARVAEAVQSGKFQSGPAMRAQYELISEEPDRIRFCARTLLTAIGVGLNEVTLERQPDGGITYFVRFYRWLYYCFFITLVVLAVPAGMLFGRLAGPALGLKPAFGSGGPGVTLALAAVVVLGLFWPFLLTILHKPMARGFLEQLVRLACAESDSVESPALPGLGGMRGGYEYVSQFTVWGLPLVHVVFGPQQGCSRGVAKGVIAVGDTAYGVLFAFGGVACGGVAVGGLSFGLVTLGGVAIGGAAVGGLAVGLVALGGFAIGGLAMGGMAVGYYAFGGSALGVHTAGGGALSLH